jgi:type IV pilus assembly protein PilB
VIHDKTIKLGEMLLSEGLVTEEQLRAALVKQQTEGGRIGEILVTTGALSAQALVKCLAKRLGVKGCCLRHGLIDPKVARLLGRDEAERLGVLPMFKVGETLTVAMAEPQSLPTIDRLSEMTHCQINPVLVLPETITEYSAKYLSEEANVETFLTSLSDSDVQFVEREADEGPVTDLDRMVEGSPIVNLVNLAILRAVRDGASDIHVEPDKRGTRIRYRIDGVLRELMSEGDARRHHLPPEGHRQDGHCREAPAAGGPRAYPRRRPRDRHPRLGHAHHSRREGGFADSGQGQFEHGDGVAGAAQ